ncbi:class I SAM-dependent RNA methyltransferase [bacterium]|nr:class I SAM-dependent RNA methyltransferase [bacterium]
MPQGPHNRRESPLSTEDWQGVIERLGWGGQGLGRLADGRLVLLDSALALFPGEEVQAEIQIKSRHAEGWVRDYITRDPRRVAAGCPYAGECGGCSLWEAGEAAAELKLAMVRDLLHRQLRDVPDCQWLPAPPDTRRSRVQLHWDGQELGYYAQRSHTLVPVEVCPMAEEPVSAAIKHLRHALRHEQLPAQPDRWELVGGTPVGDVAAVELLDPHRAWRFDRDGWRSDTMPMEHRLGGFQLEQAPGSFFQACPQWAWQALSGLLQEWEVRGETLYDLYGGCGLFSVMLSTALRRLVLVESNSLSTAAAQINLANVVADRNDFAVHCADVAVWLEPGLGSRADVILTDPPRAGLAKPVVERLLTAQAGTLILVGCDGMAFCRDVKALAPAWRLEHLAAIDLFPNTPLVEFVGLCRRVKDNG